MLITTFYSDGEFINHFCSFDEFMIFVDLTESCNLIYYFPTQILGLLANRNFNTYAIFSLEFNEFQIHEKEFSDRIQVYDSDWFTNKNYSTFVEQIRKYRIKHCEYFVNNKSLLQLVKHLTQYADWAENILDMSSLNEVKKLVKNDFYELKGLRLGSDVQKLCDKTLNTSDMRIISVLDDSFHSQSSSLLKYNKRKTKFLEEKAKKVRILFGETEFKPDPIILSIKLANKLDIFMNNFEATVINLVKESPPINVYFRDQFISNYRNVYSNLTRQLEHVKLKNIEKTMTLHRKISEFMLDLKKLVIGDEGLPLNLAHFRQCRHYKDLIKYI